MITPQDPGGSWCRDIRNPSSEPFSHPQVPQGADIPLRRRIRLCRAQWCCGRNRALELESGARVAAKDHHIALRTEVLGKIDAGYIEIVLAKLQWGKDDVAFTLHVNPSAFTSSGLQTTDWLRFLGFKQNAQCQFSNARQCFSKEVPEGYDLQRFATAFNEGFAQLQKAAEGLQVCGL